MADITLTAQPREMIGKKVNRAIPSSVGARKIIASHRSTNERRAACGFAVRRGGVDVVVMRWPGA